MGSSESLVDVIFGKCALVYGRDFAGKWEGMSLDEVKADWTRELGGWLDRPYAIRHALEHLPLDRPPNVLQFRALCAMAPEQVLPCLASGLTEEQRAEGRKRIAEIMGKLRA